MSTHTPGPWTPIPRKEIPGYREGTGFVIRSPKAKNGELPVAIAPANRRPREMVEANARLIAAAPDLLDLARNVAGLDPAYVEKIDGPVLVVAAIREWIEQARTAIAKAEGTS